MPLKGQETGFLWLVWSCYGSSDDRVTGRHPSALVPEIMVPFVDHVAKLCGRKVWESFGVPLNIPVLLVRPGNEHLLPFVGRFVLKAPVPRVLPLLLHF